MKPPRMTVSPFFTAISDESVRLSVFGTLPDALNCRGAVEIINFLR